MIPNDNRVAFIRALDVDLPAMVAELKEKAAVPPSHAELQAEVEQWRATFGRDALPGALSRLNKAEAEVERLTARVAELELAAQTRHCGRAMVHPDHRWMSDRQAVQCPGTKAGER